MKRLLVSVLLLLATSHFAYQAAAENYQVSGAQRSHIEYQMVQNIRPAPGTHQLTLTYVLPPSYESPTYRQQVEHLSFDFNPRPYSREKKSDNRGNRFMEVTWNQPSRSIRATISLTTANRVDLATINTQAPFPPRSLPQSVRVYLKPSKQVNSRSSEIQKKARELTAAAKSQFDAIQRILTWVVDHMHYVLTPPRYDAGYSFRTGSGNCQNYSHLAAALMRAVGIPVRIVNGICLKKTYNIKTKTGIMTMGMAQGRHSWIEVYLGDLGWVPFDPATTELFVSTRYLRVEVGIDNDETGKDSMVSWTHSRGSKASPHFEESISSRFAVDQIQLSAQRMNYGPRKLLLCPPVTASFAKAKVPKPPKPVVIPTPKLKKLKFTKPYMVGNLEFPLNVDFLNTYDPARQQADGTSRMRKNFLVETAEYVTTKGQQYAQTVVLRKPMKLEVLSLALHKFNNQGQLWLELYKDKSGRPGKYITTSDMLDLQRMRYSAGYTWVDFRFGRKPLILQPGRYWLALGFTGGPIVNWFYSYGKPVGPADGTRYKTLFDDTWSRSLSYEFNYRLLGKTSG